MTFQNWKKGRYITYLVTRIILIKSNIGDLTLEDLIERLIKCRRLNDPIMIFLKTDVLFLIEVKDYKKYNFLVFEISCNYL